MLDYLQAYAAGAIMGAMATFSVLALIFREVRETLWAKVMMEDDES